MAMTMKANTREADSLTILNFATWDTVSSGPQPLMNRNETWSLNKASLLNPISCRVHSWPKRTEMMTSQFAFEVGVLGDTLYGVS